MADSVDRVFVHALNTVKKIPKTGATRPPPTDRMRLYGLYKQAMEGDVDGVMERPNSNSGLPGDELRREQDKWDAWDSQRGLSRTEAKRRYIEALIDTMHKYATTPNAAELVSELEFVWNQIKDNSPTSSDEFAKQLGMSAIDIGPKRFVQPASGPEGPMKILSPMSEEDEAEHDYQRRIAADEPEDDGEYVKRGDRWSKKMERAIVRLSAEIAALREQITTGREWRSKKERSFGAWVSWSLWVVTKHVVADIFMLALVLLWMRRRKDRRLEDHVRAAVKIGRERHAIRTCRGLTGYMASAVNGRDGPSTPAQPDAPMAIDPTNGKHAQQEPEEDIPPLTHIIPTIFVPLTEDLLQPIEPAKDRVERMERMVASLDASEKKVRNNIAWTYEREARRHVAAMKKTGAFASPHEPTLMSWEEAEAHVANMSVPANPSITYHLPPEKIAEFKAYDQSRADMSLPDNSAPYERISQEVLIIGNRGVTDMEAYSNIHVKGIRDRLNASLEKEKRAVASFDKPRS
ncbi:hypothetical protein VMCG_04405 [Cytospora schulzeri]|uniref:ACB domain-containing protein n=1 Tax=Cytospora schulzeri TaxID=448051 RepID=A0A423WSX5_9PEZI|nr:hypothetical protein VMCG_04405 [Valsa malicola]